MPTFGHAHGIFCALHESTARNTGYGWGTAEVAATAGRLDAHTRAAACAPRSSIGQLHRQYPAGFASVVAAVASTGQLQLLQDPLWLAAVGAAQAWQHSTNVKTPRTTEAARMSAAAEEGSSVAEAIRDAALETGGEDPLLRLQLAVLLGEAAALLHSIGEALAASSLRKSVGGHKSTVLGSEDSQRMAVAAGRSAYELELWHIRLTALPVSVSVVSLGSREGVPWKPRPCGALSAVAAKPLLQQTAATDELLLLNQQVRLAIRFLTTLASCALEKIQPLHLRCMQALQQAQQLAFQLALPGEAVTAGMPAKAAPELAAAADTSTSCPDTCGDVGLPPPISLTSRPHYSKMNWQLLLTGRGLLAAPVPTKAWSIGGKVQHEVLRLSSKPLGWPLGNFLWSLRSIGKRNAAHEVLLPRGVFLPTVSPYWRDECIGCCASVQPGSTVESSFLLRHAAKLHALLTFSRRPELALR